MRTGVNLTKIAANMGSEQEACDKGTYVHACGDRLANHAVSEYLLTGHLPTRRNAVD